MRDDLMERLDAFSFDVPGTVRTFAARLAEEQRWSHTFTARVVREYRRFVWLAMRAGHEVTPSPAVDAAWHLHLSYTRSYWHELCERLLGRPLHHEPSRGGAAERARFAAAYARTLASYRACFGEPPADVWPTPRLDRAAPARRRPVTILTAAIGAAPLVAAGGCMAAAGAGAIDVTLVLAVAVGAVALALWSRSRSRAAHGAQAKRRRASSGAHAPGATRNAVDGGAACGGVGFVPIPFTRG